jgi:hypothetical protein
MRKRILISVGVLLAVVVAVICFEPTHILRGSLRGESFYRGRPTSYWRIPVYQRMHRQPDDKPPTAPTGSWVDWLYGSNGVGAMEPSFSGPSDPAAIPVLVDLLEDEDDQVQFFACNALRFHGAAAKAAVPALRKMLTNADIYRRRNAANTLAAPGSEARPALPELIQALDEDDSWVNYFAAFALGNIGPDAREAIPPLRRLLASDRAKTCYLGPGKEDGILNVKMDKVGDAAAWALEQIDPTQATQEEAK